jgi:hypothetical protein
MMTIDQVPLDWFFRPGVKLDFRKMADGHVFRIMASSSPVSRTR